MKIIRMVPEGKSHFFTFGIFGSAARWYANGCQGPSPKDIDVAVWRSDEREHGNGRVCDSPLVLSVARHWARSVGLPSDLAIDTHWMPAIGTPVGVESVFVLLGDSGHEFTSQEVRTLTGILRAAEFDSAKAMEVLHEEIRAERLTLWLDHQGIHLPLQTGWTGGYHGEGLRALQGALGHTPIAFLSELGAFGTLLSDLRGKRAEELVAMSDRFFRSFGLGGFPDCEKQLRVLAGFESLSTNDRLTKRQQMTIEEFRARAGL